MHSSNPRRVVIAHDGEQYTVTRLPHAIVAKFDRFSRALKQGEAIAREWQCALNNDTSHGPLVGDRGPVHLIGSPQVFVTEEAGVWDLSVACPPWGMGNLERSFVGVNAERAARKYGDSLFATFRQKALDEEARRARIKELKSPAAVREAVR